MGKDKREEPKTSRFVEVPRRISRMQMKSVPRNVKTFEEKEAKKATDPAGGGDGGGTRFHGSLFITLDGRPYIFPLLTTFPFIWPNVYLTPVPDYPDRVIFSCCYYALCFFFVCFFSRREYPDAHC